MWELFTTHLDANDVTTRCHVYHSVRYGVGDARRASIYFNFAGLPRLAFEQRFAKPVAVIDAALTSAGGRRPDRYHIVSYDFMRAALSVGGSSTPGCRWLRMHRDSVTSWEHSQA
jgi:hypothetical protein